MSAQTKTCLNCYHRQGTGISGQCSRTGYYITTELQLGGRCAPKMLLWEPREQTTDAPRRTLWMRLTGKGKA